MFSRKLPPVMHFQHIRDVRHKERESLLCTQFLLSIHVTWEFLMHRIKLQPSVTLHHVLVKVKGKLSL
jgi:hypothetical protein